MIKVYLAGHGFMHETEEITLTKKLVTYVKDGKMYDGPCTKPLIDDDSYPIDKDYKEVNNNGTGTKVKEHYFTSDMASCSDINESKYWEEKVRTEVGSGVLFKFSDTIYAYTSKYKHSIRLSDLITTLTTTFEDEDFEIHWTACRSIIKGDSDESLLEKMNSGSLVAVEGMVTS